MRHQIPGLHSKHQDSESSLDGVFLVRVERAWYRQHPQKPFVELRFVILDQLAFQDRSFSGRVYCTEKALWRLHRFLRDFGYDADLLNLDQVDEKALLKLLGIVRTSHKTFRGRAYQNLDSFAPTGEWGVLSCVSINDLDQSKGHGDSDGL